jgi:hypothetical protein
LGWNSHFAIHILITCQFKYATLSIITLLLLLLPPPLCCCRRRSAAAAAALRLLPLPHPLPLPFHHDVKNRFVSLP